jgi:fructosamine-3-kinase
MPDDSVLRSELGELRRGERITSVQRLSGGFAGDPWLVSYADGTRVVGKTLAGAPGDLFRIEAEGLATLRATGYVQTPEVLAVTWRLLLLEELPAREDTEASWAAFAADLAGLHRNTVNDRFGWDHDGYLGRLPQINNWATNGHEFFAQNRLLRYLDEPLVEQALTSTDRRALERLCDRMQGIIPAMPPVLTHDDLWSANLLGKADSGLAAIDPAISYTWAEVDLSMLWSCPRPPASDRFFHVYQELNPSPPGWAERMPLLNLRELLSVAAQETESAWAVERIRTILKPFYPS